VKGKVRRRGRKFKKVKERDTHIKRGQKLRNDCPGNANTIVVIAHTHREREGERERTRERERARERARERTRERETERQRDRETERERYTDRLTYLPISSGKMVWP
jgi:hypothetical protein